MATGRLQERVIVVTGAGQGIGAAYARRLLDEGATVVLADRNGEAAEKVAEHRPEHAHPVPVDVADSAGVRRFAATLTDRFDHVDGLINNAAIFSTIAMRPFWEIDERDWDDVLAVNLKGPWLVTSALLPLLRAAPAASIVNIGSDAPTLGRSGYLHYVASKEGVRGVTYSMAHELGEYGIRVNTISPGPVYTEIPRETVTPEQRTAMLNAQAIHRPAEPQDLVGTAVFLLSEDSAHLTGQTLSINGGLVHR